MFQTRVRRGVVACMTFCGHVWPSVITGDLLRSGVTRTCVCAVREREIAGKGGEREKAKL